MTQESRQDVRSRLIFAIGVTIGVLALVATGLLLTHPRVALAW